MKKRLLVVTAHPDDEAFGPGGTLAKYGQREDVEIHLICGTRGELGTVNPKLQSFKDSKLKTENIREKELLDSAKILGIERVEFLDFVDGHLSNSVYHDVAKKIIEKINTFKPDVILTNDRLGVSGHLDHIAVSMITTYAWRETDVAKKLYYNALPKLMTDAERVEKYFIYFPEGYPMEAFTTIIDTTDVWEIRKKAMLAHKSQEKDAKGIIKRIEPLPKKEFFILQYHKLPQISFPESDLFAGIE
ncbi:MAG: hypothetical protein UT63_C0019G0017 [Candidatus Gottesmanbacteria bacterium GW2011_GWC2_39_8]|uniref:PIG-L family deacetylase n=1 Tax=Candidatus Gottesmanbacteria bacterium GW2011_GWC2_39_8 TaxID=1618450 RepID=A0A0G0SF00_9BACT|nr:MAG: hypothetical protein UT63_C0019G0017 [Candidatus Gottesmanbacteria bacterium GW2011_GWC2_39_8]